MPSIEQGETDSNLETMQEIGTVLLIENNPDDAHLAQLAFERAGLNHSLVVVSDGLEAIEYLKGQGTFANRQGFVLPKLILLDLGMPGVSGLEILEQLRRDPELRDIPVTILSGSSYSPDLDRAYELGAKAFLEKCSNLKKFGSALKQMTEVWVGGHHPCSGQDGK